jgi:GNAT superfamily N-acetyltransferase
VRIAAEPFDAPDSAVLRAEGEAETVARYGGRDTEPGAKPTAGDIAVFLVVRDEDGAALGCGAVRPLDAETVELKRMYVRPAARGRGLGAALLRALEDEARALGARRVRLETGPGQPEAIALYERAGYRAIPCFGAYAGEPASRCFERII